MTTLPDRPTPDLRGQLGITAVYTAQVARWGGLPGAELYDLPAGRVVFALTNLVVGLARLLAPRAAPLAASVLHRQALIDAVLRRDAAGAVLELACGLSRRGALLSADPAVQVVEVDLPPVIDARRQLLARSPAGRAVLDRPNLRMVGADVATADLAPLAPGEGPLHVVAEGLLVYLSAEEQRALWRRAQALLAPRGGAFVFDLVPRVEQPVPGPVARALGWLLRHVTGGQDMRADPRTRQDLVAELREAGFAEVELLETATLAAPWGLPRPTARTRQLVFCCRVAPPPSVKAS